VGAVAFMELRAETPKPMIMFHAPSPNIRDEIYFDSDPNKPFDMTVIHNNRAIIHITKEAKSYLASNGEQLEVTSINAPALLRAQREGK